MLPKADDLNRGEARKLDLAARHALGESPQLEVQSRADVERALATPAGNDARDFRAGNLTDAVQKRLLATFGPRLLVVVIHQADKVADIYEYLAEGWLFGETRPARDSPSASDSADDCASPRGNCGKAATADVFDIGFWPRPPRPPGLDFMRQRRALGRCLYRVSVDRTHPSQHGSRRAGRASRAAAGCVCGGRILPYAVSPLLRSIQVPPDTPALASFWIACLCGLGFLAVPLVAYWLASPWFAQLSPGLSPRNRGGALFAAMGAGIAAYLAGPLLLYADTNPALDVLLMSTIVIVLAYLLGRTLDYADSLPLPFVLVPVILAMPAGAALLHADTTWLGLAAGSVVLSAAVIVGGSAIHKNRRLTTVKTDGKPPPADQAQLNSGIPADLPGLVRVPKVRTISRFLPLMRHGSG